MLKYEHQAQREGYGFIIGVDEAGRGPLAGPVVAAAVSLRKTSFHHKIKDSKILTAEEREEAFHEISDHAYIGVGVMNEAVIDRHNILQATFHAMNLAIHRLLYNLEKKQPSVTRSNMCLLVDGNIFRSELKIPYKTIVDGDALSLSIACASIVAKVTRDRILHAYDKILPHYGFKRHKGYSTPEHREAIRCFGLSFIHRKTFNYLNDTADQSLRP